MLLNILGEKFKRDGFAFLTGLVFIKLPAGTNGAGLENISKRFPRTV